MKKHTQTNTQYETEDEILENKILETRFEVFVAHASHTHHARITHAYTHSDNI